MRPATRSSERGALAGRRARPVGRVEGPAGGGDRGLDLLVGRDVDLGHDRAVGRVDRPGCTSPSPEATHWPSMNRLGTVTPRSALRSWPAASG